MHKSLAELSKFLIGIAFIVIVIGSYVIVAQTPITGEWKANTRSEKPEKKDGLARDSWERPNGAIHISFERSRGDKHRSQHGSSFAYSDLQGLTAEQTQNGRVSFRLVREAGTVEAEGSFLDGRGSGTFRFIPDAGYLASMSARGFDFAKTSSKQTDMVEERQFTAALLNVTTALADDLKSVDLGTLDVDDLFKAAIFKVDSKFMAEMKASGFPDLTMEDLVKARIFKIDADYVRQVHQMGFSNKGFEGLVKFRIFKVTPEFLNDLRSQGFDNLSSEEIVKFRIFNLDPEFIRRAKAENPSVTVEQMVEMKIGVRKMKNTH